MRAFGLAACSAVLLCGCTHTQLKHNTINQAETLSDVYTQQVMDNLAKFVYAYNSMPDFAVPDTGTNKVIDRHSLSGSLAWNTFNFTGAGLGGDAARTQDQAWTLQPVNDPHKLQLMRCAYQYAVASCGLCDAPSQSCPECDKLLEDFHAHDRSSGGIADACVKGLTNDYIHWFGAGPKCDVPDDCGCIYVGQYCDQYVWVLPCHRDKLTTLTMAILDYAMNEAPEQATKEVVTTTERDGAGNVTKSTRKETVSEPVVVDGQPVYLRPQPSSTAPTLRNLQLRLQTLE